MTFPSLKPTSRNITYGEYPVKLFKSQSGAVTTRLFGDRPSNFVLELSFQGLVASAVEQILAHYDSVQGAFQGFLLPDSLWVGEDDTLAARYQNLSGVTWYYTSPPKIEAIRGTTNRNVTLQLGGNTFG